MTTRRPALALALSLLALAAGSASAGTTADVRVSPPRSLADEPLHVLVTGLPAGAQATLELDSTDASGTRWRSSAVFRADRHGRIDVDRSPALAGSYRGVWGMGLVAKMLPATRPHTSAYVWAGPRPLPFEAVVRVRGEVVTSRRFARRLSPVPLGRRVETLRSTGFVGEYYAPVGAVRRPAVLAFGGAAGGLRTTLLASMLAARGYPTLALAYFREPGLPKRIRGIPLEYFAHALAWLGRRPEVDRARMLTLGISRGSEAALLLGVHFPNLVHGVIAAVPDNRALCPTGRCSSAPWTVRGRPIPYTNQFASPHPTDEPRAVIPVERIRGPVFLACAGRDRTWPSCAFARAIVARLEAHGSPYRHVLVAAPQAGHMLGSLAPNEPVAGDFLSRPADARAREAAWPRLLAFLRAFGH